MIGKILATLIGSVLSGMLYRAGGSAYYNTKYRDIGVSFVTTMLMGLWLGWSWPLALCAVLLFGALTSYFKKGEDSRWWNWAMVGFFCSLAAAPVLIANLGLWPGVAIRVAVVTILVTWWSETQDDPVWEEFGRGFIIAGTVPLIGVTI